MLSRDFVVCQSLTVNDNLEECTPRGFLPNHPIFWEWLSVALFCSYRSRWSDIPRKIFKRLSNNLLNLVSYYANLLHAMNLLLRLQLMLVTFLCSRNVGLLRISWDCWVFTLAKTYWQANRESQDSSGDIISLMHPHAYWPKLLVVAAHVNELPSQGCSDSLTFLGRTQVKSAK
jgi:hypothetical protein